MAAAKRHTVRMLTPAGVNILNLMPIKSLKYTLIENDIGSFEVSFPWIDDRTFNATATMNRIEIYYGSRWIFGGVILKRSIRQESEIPIVTIGGPCYNIWLARRRAKVAGGSAFDTVAARPTDNLMKEYVRRHLTNYAGFGAHRVVPHFSVALDNPQSPVSATFNARYESILDILKEIAKTTPGLFFRVLPEGASVYDAQDQAAIAGETFNAEQSGMSGGGPLRFQTYYPRMGLYKPIGSNKPVIFTLSTGNASNVEWVDDGTNVKNYVYGGGPGDGAARMIREGFHAESITRWGLVEDFVDATSVATTGELDVEIAKKLAESAFPEASLTFTVNAIGIYQYGVDFTFGDEVSAVWSATGQTYSGRISGLTVSLNEGESTTLDMSVGAPNLSRLDTGRMLAYYIRSMNANVGRLVRH